MNNRKLLLGVSILSLALAFGCASTSYLGNWNYKVSGLPDGDSTGTVTISETEDGLKCHVKDAYGYAEFDLESCVIEDDVFTGYYYDDMGTKIDVSGTFEDNVLKGFLDIQGTQFPLELVKIEE